MVLLYFISNPYTFFSFIDLYIFFRSQS